jgi:hypothetical protein
MAQATKRGERVQAEIEVELISQTTGAIVHGHVQNISEGGMYVAMDGALPPRDEVVTFIARGPGADDVIVGHGVVRWNLGTSDAKRHSGFGLEFKHLAQKNRDLLTKMFDGLKNGKGESSAA